jgi:hypothetical protein
MGDNVPPNMCVGPYASPELKDLFYTQDGVCTMKCERFLEPQSQSLCTHWVASRGTQGPPVVNGKASWACLRRNEFDYVSLSACFSKCVDGKCQTSSTWAVVAAVGIAGVAALLIALALITAYRRRHSSV